MEGMDSFGDTFAIPHLLIIVGVALVQAGLLVAAVVSIARSTASNRAKAIWLVVVLLLPLLGPLVWFVTGRRAAITG